LQGHRVNILQLAVDTNWESW